MTVKILVGDARDRLRELAAGSAHVAVTSPPYYGKRDYGVAPSAWADGSSCCLGLEPTPEAFVEHLVEVMEEVRRVLRDDGTLWMNIGDTYAVGKLDRTHITHLGLHRTRGPSPKRAPCGLRPKELIGIPWMAAFALRRAGWYVRQEVIWSKPNPMPESTRDRCTTAHESIFLLTKRPSYFYDAAAIAEPAAYAPGCGWEEEAKGTRGGKRGVRQERAIDPEQSFRAIRDVRNKRSVWTVAPEPFKEAHFATFPPALVEPCVLAGTSERGCCVSCGAPFERDEAATDAYLAFLGRSYHDHEDDAGAGMMQNRGENRANALRDEGEMTTRQFETIGWYPSCRCHALPPRPRYRQAPKIKTEAAMAEWRAHYAATREEHRRLCARANELPVARAVVLDPFGGAGTTGLVADRLQRDAVLCELNPRYAELAAARIRRDGGMLASVEVDAAASAAREAAE